MGNSQSIQKINFEDMQKGCNNKEYCIINTLSEHFQHCLIKNTIEMSNEERLINGLLNKSKNITIIIYGKNSNDEKIYKKFEQLTSLGFYNVYVYVGGLFEWLLLQDVYGNEAFPTTTKELDILKYKPEPKLDIQYITE